MTDAAVLAAQVRAYRTAYFGPTEPEHRHQRRPGFTPPPPVGLATLLDQIATTLEELGR